MALVHSLTQIFRAIMSYGALGMLGAQNSLTGRQVIDHPQSGVPEKVPFKGGVDVGKAPLGLLCLMHFQRYLAAVLLIFSTDVPPNRCLTQTLRYWHNRISRT